MIEDDFNFKEKVDEVLLETGFSESRAAKMDINDLLKCVNRAAWLYISLTEIVVDCCQPSTTLAFTSHDRLFLYGFGSSVVIYTFMCFSFNMTAAKQPSSKIATYVRGLQTYRVDTLRALRC